MREQVKAVIDSCKDAADGVPTTAFDSTCLNVMRELKNDGFSRYVETKRLSSSPTKSVPDNHIILNTSFDEKLITRKDILELKTLDLDSDLWYVAKHTYRKDISGNSVSSYIYEAAQQALDGRKFMLSKFTGVLPRSAQTALLAMIEVNNRSLWDTSFKSDKLIHFTKSTRKDEYTVSLSQYIFKVKTFLKLRESMRMGTLVLKESERKYMWVSKTTSAYGHDPTSKNCFVDFCSMMSVTPLSNSLCKYSFVNAYHLEDDDKEFHYVTVSRKLEKHMHEGLLQIVTKPTKNPTQDNRLFETLDVFAT
ncbi:hypothetical protein AKO1_005373 [Acrasis kona]|uniref:START domain-containing protein n=1 Tax=Acrasis kona TaxID=1008807 RepID=A0AAW2YM40_9EUKA